MASIEDILGTAGRMRRRSYAAWYFLVILLPVIGFQFAGLMLRAQGLARVIGMVLVFVLLLAWLLGAVVMMARRLHDLGQSGLHVLWILPMNMMASVITVAPGDAGLRIGAALISTLISGWLMFAPGDRLANAYGPSPRQRA